MDSALGSTARKRKAKTGASEFDAGCLISSCLRNFTIGKYAGPWMLSGLFPSPWADN
jgi:hypothetical protein